MSYVLEDDNEFNRLEKQSTHPNYNYKEELRFLNLKPGMKILDAGCGSGVVCRYLAQTYPSSEIVGCDLADTRVQMAKKHSAKFKNISFKKENLTSVSFADNSFDVVICRYVIQHLQSADAEKVISEFFRVLKPAGKLVVIDTDGLLVQFYPTPKVVKNFLEKMTKKSPVDLFVGRKLPTYLAGAKFSEIDWHIDVVKSKAGTSSCEADTMKERFHHAMPILAKICGSESGAKDFAQKYVGLLEKHSTVYFHNKFIVSATKSVSENRNMKLKLLKGSS